MKVDSTVVEMVAKMAARRVAMMETAKVGLTVDHLVMMTDIQMAGMWVDYWEVM